MPVPLPMALAIYFTTWWIVLFAVLPFGITSQDEQGLVSPGTDRGAPMAPRLVGKALWTTAIAAVLFVLLMLFIRWTQGR